MRYIRFFLFSITGNILWVVTFSLGGFYFGNIPFIRNNFSLVILGIIVISLIPVMVAVLKRILGEKASGKAS